MTSENSPASHLFSPLEIRGVSLKNRIVVSPMCQYSSVGGFANDWHLVHLGARAVGGASLVFTEATAVEPRGRISPGDLGLWKDEHVAKLAEITGFLKAHGAVPGIQLAHAGRKGSAQVPWEGGAQIDEAGGGWRNLAPSAIPFRDTDIPPAEMTRADIALAVEAFRAAAVRAVSAGFEVIEIHGAHGYLINEFLSPLANHRADEYGGSLENRVRFCLEIVNAVREAIPDSMPLFLRISAQDWAEGGWQLEDSVALSRRVKDLGVDLIDCSSGGAVAHARIAVGPGYQTPFADRIRNAAGVMTGAVGMITEPDQADAIIREGRADIVLLARAFLRDPYWPYRAAKALGADKNVFPVQYQRAVE